MALTILERPEGHIVDFNNLVIGQTYDFGGFVQIDFAPSGNPFVTDNVIYIISNSERYNGFKKVGSYNATQIQVLNLDGTNDGLEFLQATEATVHPTSGHHFSAVHLPITYKLSNNLYPTNSADSAANINSVQNANDFTVLQLSGSPGTVHSYDFLKLTVPNDTDLSGVYQIVEFISPTVMIINLQYDASNNFTSATAIKQYNNYTVLVRVYAGLNASHAWAAEKPYELAATLEFTPDSDNEVFFSVNEILKSYIETRNNLVLGTLPSNIDFFTQFYIETAEKYDDSDGYTFGSFTDSFTSDQGNFEGTAVNAKLEFKNVYSGYLSDYIMSGTSSKFLTLFVIPVLFQCGDDTPNCYQDISFLNTLDSDTEIILQKEFYENGSLALTTETSLGNPDIGVIRAELEADCDYDRVDITLGTPINLENGDISGGTIAPSTSVDTGTGWPAWTYTGAFSGAAIATTPSNTLNSQRFRMPLEVRQGYTYEFEVTFRTTDGGAGAGQNTNLILFIGSNSTPASPKLDLGTTIVQLSLLADADYDYVEFVSNAENPGGYLRDVLILNVTLLTPILLTPISETKQFRIECGCVDQEIRLTWLNNLGGFDYWAFTANKDHIREIQEVVTTKNNILPNWPKSYGADADTIRKQTKRVSNKAYTIRSQFLTADEADALAFIKSSILVQIINSQTDRRTVIVDSDSFIVRKDGDDTYEVAFNISFTDDIAVQTL